MEREEIRTAQEVEQAQIAKSIAILEDTEKREAAEIQRTLAREREERDREIALTVAGYFDRYLPALPFIRNHPPGLHYHVISDRGNDGSNPSERFDTRVEAETFANAPDTVDRYGRVEVVECSQAHPLCQPAGVRP